MDLQHTVTSSLQPLKNIAPQIRISEIAVFSSSLQRFKEMLLYNGMKTKKILELGFHCAQMQSSEPGDRIRSSQLPGRVLFYGINEGAHIN
jgi:hypothetical protein